MHSLKDRGPDLDMLEGEFLWSYSREAELRSLGHIGCTLERASSFNPYSFVADFEHTRRFKRLEPANQYAEFISL